MERDLYNKVVVVTGGAEGIGFAIAETFLQQGAIVIILDVNEIKGAESVETLKVKYGENRVKFMKCDVTKDLEIISKLIFDKYERVHLLVNNAGIVNEDNVRQTLEVNTIAVVEWTMKFREHMRKDKAGLGGTIINIASIYGFLVDPFLMYYKASKYAVMGFTKSLGHEDNYKKTGVRVIAICPGRTLSSIISKPLAWDEHIEEFEKALNNMPGQSTEAVGRAAVEVFKKADSGTAWIISGNELMEQV